MKNKNFKVSLFIYFLLFQVIHISTAFSQVDKKSKIYGYVTDTTNSGISYTTVSLYKNDTVQKVLITDSLGIFSFNKIAYGRYILVFRCLGYNRKDIDVTISKGKNVANIGQVKLINDETILNEVVIHSNNNKIKVYVDKTVFIPDSISLKESINGLELLRHVPNVNVSPIDNSIMVKGNKNVLILINGISCDRDLNTINATDIKDIEVITNPSSKYQSDVENIVNIVLKNEKQVGLKITSNLQATHENKFTFANIAIDYNTNKAKLFLHIKHRYRTLLQLIVPCEQIISIIMNSNIYQLHSVINY